MMKGVKPVFLFIGLGMMFLYVGCEAFSSYMTMRALKQPWSSSASAVATPLQAFTLPPSLPPPREDSPCSCTT